MITYDVSKYTRCGLCGKKMQGMIFLGYPAVTYPNKVEGIKPDISFI